MKYFLPILLIIFSHCQLRNKLSKAEISKVISTKRWIITQVTDNFYGDKTVYGSGYIPKTGLSKGNFNDLGNFKVAIKFGAKDSAYIEEHFWNLPADSSMGRKPDKYSRKWYSDIGLLIVKTDLKKVTNYSKPILYGQFKVKTCTDSILILQQNIDKNKWTRIFILER